MPTREQGGRAHIEHDDARVGQMCGEPVGGDQRLGGARGHGGDQADNDKNQQAEGRRKSTEHETCDLLITTPPRARGASGSIVAGTPRYILRSSVSQRHRHEGHRPPQRGIMPGVVVMVHRGQIRPTERQMI